MVEIKNSSRLIQSHTRSNDRSHALRSSSIKLTHKISHILAKETFFRVGPKTLLTSSIAKQTSNSDQVKPEEICNYEKPAGNLKFFKENWTRTTHNSKILDIINSYYISSESTLTQFALIH